MTTYTVTAAGRPAGSLACDPRRERASRWRWCAGNLVEQFPDMLAAKDRIAALHRCKTGDVKVVEAPPPVALFAGAA